MLVRLLQNHSIACGCILFLTCMVTYAAEDALGMSVRNYQAQGNDVSGRNFDGANLSLANFSGSNARGSSFRNAKLDYANLSMANFSQADLSNVSFKLALVEFTDFSEAKGVTAAQLSEACLTRVDKEDRLGVEWFDTDSYHMPEGCQLWELIPRSLRE